KRTALVGGVLDGLSNLIPDGTSDPGASSLGGPTFASLQAASADYGVRALEAKECDDKDAASAPACRDELKTTMRLQAMANAIKAGRRIKDIFSKKSASNDEVQAELDRLRSSDPLFGSVA